MPSQPSQSDGFACIDEYPEHDYEVFDEGSDDQGEWRVLHCRRCGAESIEEEEDN